MSAQIGTSLVEGVNTAIGGVDSAELLAADRAHKAQCARQNAQRMRLLAAQRAEQLEQALKNAVEIGARVEISRALAARRRLQVVEKIATESRTLRHAEQDEGVRAVPADRITAASAGAFAGRYCVVGVLGLLIGAAIAALAPLAADLAGAADYSARAPVLRAVPGDRLSLTLSYSVSAPAAR